MKLLAFFSILGIVTDQINKFAKINLLFIRINNKTNSNNILVYIKNNILVNIKANILVEKICWEHHY